MQRSHPVFIYYDTSTDSLAAFDRKAMNGIGSPSTIKLSGESFRAGFGLSRLEIDFPTHVITFHELVHALHSAQGKLLPKVEDPMSSVWTDAEERRTITFYENIYRYELDIPLRCSHHTGIHLVNSPLLIKACEDVRDQFKFLGNA